VENSIDPIQLTRELIAFDTVNPPGQERRCIELLAVLLQRAGFNTQIQEFGSDRANLIASVGGASNKLPLCFTGHVDTVPLGVASWTKDPFGGEIQNGKLFGRGSSDMKGGVSAFVASAYMHCERLRETCGIVLIITSGEETGAEGACELVGMGGLPQVGALVVAEPTSNVPMIGHKGVLWLKALLKGKTSHGSMPHLGVNAAYRAADALKALERLQFGNIPYHALGPPTLSVGTVRAGLNVNSVPDSAEIAIDIRTNPHLQHSDVRDHLSSVLGVEVSLETMLDLNPIWTPPDDDWIIQVCDVVRAISYPSLPHKLGAVPYFTDASVLKPVLGHPPTVILGPGEASMAHQTDEYCLVERINEAYEIYSTIITKWCGV
jgi:succinyl-diaminopimelate desuccinylase